MEVIAEAKFIKTSPRKVRLVVETIRKLSPNGALSHLAILPKRAAIPIAQVLKSALANAKHNLKLAEDNLRIKSIVVNEGPSLKRWRPVSRGRAHPYKRRMSHIKIVLEAKKKNGTKS